MITISNLAMQFGSDVLFKNVDLQFTSGKCYGVIGANGAGKSTTLRTISGLVKAKAGRIVYDGRDITSMNPQKIVSEGIAMVPEGRHVFDNLTVKENLLIGAYLRKDRESINEDIEHIYTLFPRLHEREWQLAGTLSGGEQQMLAVGRAIMTQPRILMMDEPSLGLAPIVVKEIFSIIRTLNETGMTILLIEQNANAALRCSHRAYVMETGRITMSGPSADLLADKRVQDAYLGAK